MNASPSVSSRRTAGCDRVSTNIGSLNWPMSWKPRLWLISSRNQNDCPDINLLIYAYDAH